MRTYDYRHTVTLEETNVMGNVYYVNHLRWQGRCRELFLGEHAPEVLQQLGTSLCIVTSKCACEYLAELVALDEVIVRMRIGELVQNRIVMRFEYYRSRDGAEELIARGEQEVLIMRRDDGRLVPAPVPEALREALRPYMSA